MTVDLSIRGAEGIARVARDVRRLGSDRTIVNEMAKEIRAAVPPIRKAIKANELAVLPKRNGLNKWVASGRIDANIRRSEKRAGVTISQGRNSERKRTDMKALDRGRIRSPLFGNRRAWYLHTVPAGAFTNAVTDEGATEFRQAVVRAADNAVAKII